ncbi:MAG TPA: response regulator [Spirochaetia bacterium]|nr:response regulator [Spirochaetia bacterium]
MGDAPGAARPLIFLVDDDADFLEMEAAILSAGGYRTRTFSESSAALAALAAASGTERPALLVTDLMMKSLDAGFTFARAVRSDPRFSDIRLVIVSAVAAQKGFDFRPRSAGDLAAMNADAFFDKPVPAAEFLARVKELAG